VSLPTEPKYQSSEFWQPGSFDPDWVVAPGETLADWFEEIGLPKSAASRFGLSERTLNGVLAGTTKITPAIARKLGNLTGIGAPMWLALEHNFRVGLAAGKSWSRAATSHPRGDE
jgi:plasmid maintenance system antidote protein VapI